MCERIAHVQFFVADDPGEHERDEDVKNRADHQRVENSSWQIALGIFAFFSSRGNGVEANEGPEDGGHAFEHAGQSIWRERGPVLWIDIEEADRNDRHDDDEFYGDHDVVRIAT